MIGCSDAQSIHISEVLNEPCKTVHHGIDLDMYPFESEKLDRYLSLNRITNFKGIDEFVNIMNRCGVVGDVVGEDKFVENQDYVKTVSSMCDDSDNLRYIGSVSQEKKIAMLQNAKAVVSLPMLDRGYLEIFGLNITEAMACGTPVIGLRNGGLIDQISDGVTGFLCASIEEVEEIIKSDKVSEIDPACCRDRAEKLFSREQMAKNCLSLYKDVQKKEEW